MTCGQESTVQQVGAVVEKVERREGEEEGSHEQTIVYEDKIAVQPFSLTCLGRCPVRVEVQKGRCAVASVVVCSVRACKVREWGCAQAVAHAVTQLPFSPPPSPPPPRLPSPFP